MMNKTWMKKAVIGGMALTMAISGATAAFADSKGKGNAYGHDKDRGKGWGEVKYEAKKDKFELKLSFDDVRGSDVEWAIRYIASLASRGVFEGYEDGTFQPRKTISRIEAITAAVRLMGLREQAEASTAMNTQLNFKDADKVASKYPWAVGYVAIALENDLFEESEESVQPEKEADRLWATTLLVKAMKLQAEAKSKMNTKLSFRDAGQIPAGSVGYVAVALEKKLIDGYEDRTFRPNQPVTRAELAALLDRTGTQLPTTGSASTQGTVTATVGSTNVLTLVKDGQTQQLALDSNVFIFRNNTKVASSELRVGDEVRVNLYDNRVVFIEVTKPVEQQNVDFAVTGTYTSHTYNSKGEFATISINQTVNGGVQTSVYSVSSNLSIVGDLTLLTAGRTVELKGTSQQVHTITIR